MHWTELMPKGYNKPRIKSPNSEKMFLLRKFRSDLAGLYQLLRARDTDGRGWVELRPRAAGEIGMTSRRFIDLLAQGAKEGWWDVKQFPSGNLFIRLSGIRRLVAKLKLWQRFSGNVLLGHGLEMVAALTDQVTTTRTDQHLRKANRSSAPAGRCLSGNGMFSVRPGATPYALGSDPPVF